MLKGENGETQSPCLYNTGLTSVRLLLPHFPSPVPGRPTTDSGWYQGQFPWSLARSSASQKLNHCVPALSRVPVDRLLHVRGFRLELPPTRQSAILGPLGLGHPWRTRRHARLYLDWAETACSSCHQRRPPGFGWNWRSRQEAVAGEAPCSYLKILEISAVHIIFRSFVVCSPSTVPPDHVSVPRALDDALYALLRLDISQRQGQ